MKRTILLFVILIFSFCTINAQWQQTSLNNEDVNCLAVNGSALFAGTFSNGVFSSNNNGANWVAINNGLTYPNIRALAISGNNLFAATYGGGVFISNNNGANWTPVNKGFTDSAFVRTLAINGNNLFAGGGHGVYLSTDSGTSWTAVNTGLTNQNVFSLAINGNNLFAGTYQGVFISNNNGISWTSAGLDTLSVLALEFSGSNLFAGTITGGGVFLSTDNGASWTSVNSGIPFGGDIAGQLRQINTFAVSGTNIFAGSIDGGVFLSSNNGTSWTETGLDVLSVSSLTLCGGNLFAGTFATNLGQLNGVFVAPISLLTGINKSSDENMQVSLYPNPSNDVVYLTTNTTTTKKTLLQVFDVTGKLMLRGFLQNEISVIDASKLAEGVYNLCITSEEQKINKRLVIVK